MSISAKKINQMIIEEFSSKHHASENTKLLNDLARNIYVIESSFEGGSDRQKIDEIRDILALKANEYIVK